MCLTFNHYEVINEYETCYPVIINYKTGKNLWNKFSLFIGEQIAKNGEHLEGKRKKQNKTDEPCGNALAFWIELITRSWHKEKWHKHGFILLLNWTHRSWRLARLRELVCGGQTTDKIEVSPRKGSKDLHKSHLDSLAKFHIHRMTPQGQVKNNY